MSWEELEGYEPQKERDDFEVIKERQLKCGVDWGRVETDEREGDNKGRELYRYCLVVLEHPEHTNRKFWSKRYYLDNAEDLKKLADVFWTVGLRFKNREELEKANEEFVNKTVTVRAWGWTPPDADEARQMHVIKGEATEGDTSGSAKPAF